MTGCVALRRCQNTDLWTVFEYYCSAIFECQEMLVIESINLLKEMKSLDIVAQNRL